MQPFTNTAGLNILSELGKDAFTRRFRLDSPDPRFLVVFDEPTLARAVSDGAKRFGSLEVDGFARVGRVLEEEGLLGLEVHGEIGDSVWRLEPLGEAKSLPLLHQVATVIASLHVEGVSHGMLRPDGVTVLADGRIMVLPPVILPDYLYEVAGATGGAPNPVDEDLLCLSRAGRDLAALAALACQLIAGLTPQKSAGVGALPEELKNRASPASAQAVRILLEAAGRSPSPSEAAEVLIRIGWARGVAPPPPGRDRPPVIVQSRRPTAPAAVRPAPGRAAETRSDVVPAGDAGDATSGSEVGTGSARPSRRPRPASRIARATDERAEAAHQLRSAGEEEAEAPRRRRPRISPVLVAVVTLVLGGGLFLVGSGGSLAGLWSDGGGGAAALPTPSNPLAVVERAESVAEPALESDSSGEQTSPDGNAVDAEAAALVDQILAGLEGKRPPAEAGSSRSFDRSLIDEGDELRAEAQVILAALRDRTVVHAERNAKLEEAINLLERSREKYLSFAEQFASRKRLVESSVEEVNSLIFFAYRQKTSK